MCDHGKTCLCQGFLVYPVSVSLDEGKWHDWFDTCVMKDNFNI